MNTNTIFITDSAQLENFIENAINKALSKNNALQTETRLLTKNQARLKLEIGYSKLEEYISTGKIKAIGSGKKQKISEFELNKFIANE